MTAVLYASRKFQVIAGNFDNIRASAIRTSVLTCDMVQNGNAITVCGAINTFLFGGRAQSLSTQAMSDIGSYLGCI